MVFATVIPWSEVNFDEGSGPVTAQSLSDYTAELLADPSPFGGVNFGARWHGAWTNGMG